MKFGTLLFVMLITIGISIYNKGEEEEIMANSNEATSGMSVETDEKTFDEEIDLIIQELHYENKTELTKAEVEVLFKQFLKKQSDLVESEGSPQFLKDAVQKMLITLEKEVIDMLPEKIPFKDLKKYITLDKISEMFMKLMDDIGPQMENMREDQAGYGQEEIFSDPIQNKVNDDL